MGGLNSGEPSVDQISIIANRLDIQFDVFVGDGVRVRQDPVIVGPHAASRISLICYPVAGESHFGLVFGENISGPRMTSSQFSDFSGQTHTILDVGRCENHLFWAAILVCEHVTIFARYNAHRQSKAD